MIAVGIGQRSGKGKGPMVEIVGHDGGRQEQIDGKGRLQPRRAGTGQADMRGDVADPDQQRNEDAVKEIVTVPAPAYPVAHRTGQDQFKNPDGDPGAEDDDDAEISLADRRLQDLAPQAAAPEQDQEPGSHIPGHMIGPAQDRIVIHAKDVVFRMLRNMTGILKKIVAIVDAISLRRGGQRITACLKGPFHGILIKRQGLLR